MEEGAAVSLSAAALSVAPPRAETPAGVRRFAGAPGRSEWGALPSLALVAAVGLLLVALGFDGARAGRLGAETLFWLGLLLVVAPAGARLAGAEASRQERIGLVALVGVALYLAKVWHSPAYFTFYDELQHWRTTDDVLRSGRLFTENPVLPVSPSFPGLENATSALASLSGVSIFGAGIIVVGVARLVLALALFALYETVGGSPRLAGVAALLYMANPNFLFFDAQFAYESLALPFAVLTLYAAARRAQAPPGQRVGLTLVALLGLGATVVTHHLTAYALVAFLVLWVAAGRLAGRLAGPGRVELPGSAGLALLAVVVSLAWLLYVGGLTVSYLAPIFERGLQDVSRWLAEGSTGRRLFQDASGRSSPVWEQIAAYGAVASLLLALPFGLWRVWHRYRHNAAALALTAGALAYPVSLALRLTPRGLEIANRASEFLFLALVFVVAVAVCGPSSERAPERAPEHGWTARLAPLRRWGAPAFGAWVALLFAGGIVLGWPAFARLPGPYRPAAPVRSIDPQAVAAAEWTRQYLGPGNRVASDVSNQLTLAAYGAQRTETNGYHVPRLFLSAEVGPEERETIRNWRIRYLVVDRRLSQSLPMIGIYYGMWEPDGYNHARPVGQGALAKFDAVPEVHRLLHSGDVVVYDVGGLAGAP